MKVTKLKLNPDNPRLIKDARFEKLCKSLKDFPEMMKLREIVIDEDNMILGGNMRFKALKELGYTDIPDEWIKCVTDLTNEQKQEFIIKDNIGFGDDDWEILNNWDKQQLEDWGLEVNEKTTKDNIKGDVEFSDELMLEHNYIVLYFDNIYDWQVAIEKAGLKDVKSCIKTEPSQKVGISRVIKGMDIINKI